MSKVTLQGHMEVSEADLSSILEALPKHVELTRNEAGCLIFDVIPNSKEANILTGVK